MYIKGLNLNITGKVKICIYFQDGGGTWINLL